MTFGAVWWQHFNERIETLGTAHYVAFFAVPVIEIFVIIVWLGWFWPITKPPKSQDAPDLADLLLNVKRTWRKGDSVLAEKDIKTAEGNVINQGTKGFVVEDKETSKDLGKTHNVRIVFEGESARVLLTKWEARGLDIIEEDMSRLGLGPSEQSLLDPSSPNSAFSPKVLKTGEEAGNYKAPWTRTFDLRFLILMIVLGTFNWVITHFEPFTNSMLGFLAAQCPKWGIMMGVSCLGGIIARQYCNMDDNGYMLTNQSSWFRVNYTRKLQHFAAYVIPLVMPADPRLVTEDTPVQKMIVTSWEYWFTLLGFLVLIKPVREMPCIGKFFMLQFNSLDRPEDRPHTLEWIILGNIFPGLICILIFIYLYALFDLGSGLTLIFVLVDAFGDGLAEPVGVFLGKHKYRCAAVGSDKKYTRSLEGSACVWIASIFFLVIYVHSFPNMYAFWTAFVVMPPVFTFGEAYAPHTLDTPVLMGGGGLVLLIIALIFEPSKLSAIGL